MTRSSLRYLSTDQLLNCPRIEDGERATSVLLHPGALGEIRRRLLILDTLSTLQRVDASPSGRGNVSRDESPTTK